MDDKELLEKAAKAAGIEGEWEQRITGPGIARRDQSARVWNPLIDDGDALRLAVQLHFTIDTHWLNDGEVTVYGRGGEASESDVTAPLAATRRAIVRAAAELAE